MRRVVLALLFVAIATAAVADERYAVVISGVSGGERYATQQQKWRSELAAFLTAGFAFADANVVVLDEESGGSSRATAANVRRLFADLRKRLTRDDTLMVVFLGHGTFDGTDAKFNLVGPDLSAAEWKSMLDGLPGRLVLVNTTASSFPFLEQLSRSGRIVITATDSAAQRFATVFPEYFTRALADRSSDFDKNGRISVWEAFAAASAGVKRHYEQRGQLATERPVLDDNGDGQGREADVPGEDGAVARTVYLDAEPGAAGGDPALVALDRQRLALEKQFEELKARRSSMTDEQYQAELERILIELAKIAQEIRKRS
ncbi:MAG: caspase family protein [Acidobacteria bacterium]|nr:caspase family protein [Acidobacteriota bacterium]